MTTRDDGLSTIEHAIGTAPTRPGTALGTLLGGAGATGGAAGGGSDTPSKRRHNAKRS